MKTLTFVTPSRGFYDANLQILSVVLQKQIYNFIYEIRH